MRVTSAFASTSSLVASAASRTLCEPLRSEPGLTRIFGPGIRWLLGPEQDEAGRIDALGHQGFGHRTGAGPELDHRAFRTGIHIGCYGACQRLAGRGHGADGEGLLDPGSDEAHLVVERNTVFLFLETAE